MGARILDLFDSLSTARLFLIWLAVIVACGCAYWLIDVSSGPGLIEAGTHVGKGLGGFATAIYFSFITATSVGYGDVLPIGATRILAVTEAVAGLLIFGLLIAKFVSYRQDMLVREIHSVTFEERLDRVQTNLHLVVSELLAISALCDDGTSRVERLAPRLETTTLVFTSELYAIHELLYNPKRAPNEPVLGAILANLSSALNTLGEVLLCLPQNLRNSPALGTGLQTLSALANDVCADCVPQVYAPSLRAWMDRIQQAAHTLG
ncbi:MAG TPA: potassium channel family protein [Candidatus Binataceae bacterium]|nr:potassium channel family protein [Candidatus Binataceae bacterium]